MPPLVTDLIGVAGDDHGVYLGALKNKETAPVHMHEPVHSCLLNLSQQTGQNSGGMLSRRRRLPLRQRTSIMLTTADAAGLGPAACPAACPESAVGRAGVAAMTGGSRLSTLSGMSARASLPADCVEGVTLAATGGRSRCSWVESSVLRRSGSLSPAVGLVAMRWTKRDLSGLALSDFRFDE